jgi:hypothetical protein
MKDKIFFYTSSLGGPNNGPNTANIKYLAPEYREDGIFVQTHYRSGKVIEFLSKTWTKEEMEKFFEDGTWTQIPAAEAALM